MASVNIVLSKRDGSVVVLPLVSGEYDAVMEYEPTSESAVVPDIQADAHHGNEQIWEIRSDVDIRVAFGPDPEVSLITGRLIFAGIPETFGADDGQKIAIMLAG